MVYRIEDTLGFSIHKAAVRLKQALGQPLRPFDLTPEQFGILARLWEGDGLSQRELADLLFKDKPTVTRMLERLEERGLIGRETDPRDRRVFRVYVTAAGRALEGPVLEAIQGFRTRAYAGISPERQRELKAELDKVFANLD